MPALLVLVLALAALLAGCGGEDEDGRPAAASPTPEATATAPEQEPPAGQRVETVATGLEVPWEIAFLPDGSALVTERPGRVRLLTAAGTLRDEPVARIEVSAVGEGGLLGLALDPGFAENRFVYLYYTTADGMRVARHRYRDGRLTEEAVVLDGVVAGPIHDSGRIHFGPDDRLWIATGDAGRPDLAQDPGSLNGKFLRMSLEQVRGDGGRPEIVSLGHRNPQGFDWTADGRLLATEHGPSGDDEINAIRSGRNYGWPEVTGRDHGDFAAPLVVYEDTIAPSGATVVAAPGTAWSGDFLVAALRGRQLRRVRLEGGEPVIDRPLFEGRFGRLRTVVNGPDGALYVLTSNRDGRGSPVAEDDRILRITPPRR